VAGVLTVTGSAFWLEPRGLIFVYLIKHPTIGNAQIYAVERYNCVKHFVIQRNYACQGLHTENLKYP
jgi:hypothetical protein